MQEEWRTVKSDPGYEVSSHGRIRNSQGHVLAAGASGRVPYLRVVLTTNKQKRTRLVHILVADAFLERTHPRQQVRHKDGDSQNNWSSNLLFGTQRDNEEDKRQHGRILMDRAGLVK